MAKLSDLKLKDRLYMGTYRYRQFDWRPGATPQKPLSQTQVAAITTAAFYLPDQGPAQGPFDVSVKGGDYSYREIPAASDLSSLQIAHKSEAFDPSGIQSDPNLALPLDRLRELQAEGRIGAVAPRHFSLMGSISAPARLVKFSAVEIAASLAADRTDAVLLTPV